MAIAPPNENINKLIEALGLDPSMLTSLVLTIEPDDFVSIKVTI